LNDNNWRRLESRSVEALVERVLGWIVVVVLLAVVGYCAVTAKPLGCTGATLLVLAGLVRRTRGSDA
jgi:hypothetical protein